MISKICMTSLAMGGLIYSTVHEQLTLPTIQNNRIHIILSLKKYK